MIIGVFKHALMITSFVLIMMLLIEYINVQTRGSWQQSLKKTRIGQYVLGGSTGCHSRLPGCLYSRLALLPSNSEFRCPAGYSLS